MTRDLSDEQMLVVQYATDGVEPTYEWVDLPVGPQPIPEWACGLTISWMDGYMNAPHFTVKTRRYVGDWPNQRYRREGRRYMAESGDGRAHVWYHSGEPRMELIGFRRRSLTVLPPKPPGPYDKNREDWRYNNGPQQWWRYEVPMLATPVQEGLGGASIYITMEDGTDIALRGPWVGASPPGYDHVGTSHGAMYISDDVLILLIARYYPHCRAARVTQYGRTSLQPVREDWDEPKAWVEARQRAERLAGKGE